MTRLVFSHEWTRLLRSPRLLVLLTIVALTLIATTWWSASTDAQQSAAQIAAAEQAREDWVGRGAANPHGMAHYGDFVFRPNGPLARLDGGVQATLGQVLRIEGHRHGMPLATTTSTAGPLARFGRFDPAFLLQDIVPLILILIGVGLVADGQRGRQGWMLAHGASGRTLVLGRAVFLASIAAALVAIVLLTTILASPEPLAGADVARFAGLVATYSIFLLIVVALTVVATSLARSSTAATFVLLGVWLVGTTVLPRATATVASTVAPLPSRDAFETAMREARSAEIDGHNPEDQRLAEMEAELMEEYGVTTREELPVNFDGIAMQVDEEVGNVVWDEHFGHLEEQLHQQGNVARAAALLNPFQSIRAVSMTFAGTDLAHDLAFQDAAEEYRRDLVKALNDEHAYGGSTTGDWSFEADAAFFAGIAPFEYPDTPLGTVVRSRTVELSGLFVWALLAVFALASAGRRLEIGGEA
ncbi:MAG: DUF3526 domain-containing protein [Acidobacteriota bacterium]